MGAPAARGRSSLRNDREEEMKPTQALHDQGQRLWLDNITRAMLRNGTLQRYIDELSVTGLTSNPTIFDNAIRKSTDYDDAIRQRIGKNLSSEEAFFEIALEDITAAADAFRPIHDRTVGLDGWVSLEVSPLLAYDTEQTIRSATDLFARANRPNLFIKIPGTPQGLPAIEEAIFAGIPVNVTLIFSREHYLAAADAYMKGVDRRVQAGLNPKIASVASLFVSRWDAAVMGKTPESLRCQLGIAVGKRAYKAYREVLNSDRWQRLAADGARPQRLLFASTGTKDPEESDVLYIEGLASPHTVNTMPEKTLLAFADHGKVGEMLPADGGDAEVVLAQYAALGVDVDALAATLQREGAESFDKSWDALMKCIATRTEELRKAG